MIEIKTVNTAVNFVRFEYCDVKIELNLMNDSTDKGNDILSYNVDTVCLYHKKAGDITNLYTHTNEGEVGIDSPIIEELKHIIKFIDELVIFKELISE